MPPHLLGNFSGAAAWACFSRLASSMSSSLSEMHSSFTLLTYREAWQCAWHASRRREPHCEPYRRVCRARPSRPPRLESRRGGIRAARLRTQSEHPPRVQPSRSIADRCVSCVCDERAVGQWPSTRLYGYSLSEPQLETQHNDLRTLKTLCYVLSFLRFGYRTELFCHKKKDPHCWW